jgi:hypothetical protein
MMERVMGDAKFDRYGCDYTDLFPGGRIEASPKTLMRQAKMTAAEYMHAAQVDIDEKFGDGFARKHPELIAAYMTTAAQDFGAATIARSIQDGFDQVQRRLSPLDAMAENVRSDHPLMGSTLSDIADGLQAIASAIPEKN